MCGNSNNLHPSDMWISLIVILVSTVNARPMGKGLSKALKYGAQIVSSPQMQSVLYGNSNLGSLSWGEITQVYRVLNHQVDVVREEVRGVEEWITYMKDTGIGVIAAFSLLVFFAILWSFRNYGLIRKIFSKIQSIPQSGTLENVRKNISDFLKIRGMHLPEDYNLGHRGQPVTPFNANYPYHMLPVQIGAPSAPNQPSPPGYNGGSTQPSG